MKEYKKTRKNYEESIFLQPEKLDSVYRLAKAKTLEGKSYEALEDLKKISTIESYESHFHLILQECDYYYEENAFEKNMLMLSDKKSVLKEVSIEIPHCGLLISNKLDVAKYKGPKLSLLNSRFEMVRTNYDDMIGKSAGNCLYKWKPPKEKNIFEPTVLSNYNPCQFLQNKVVEVPKTVKQKYQHEHIQNFFSQSYLYSSWKDYIFINDLKTHKVVKESSQNVESFQKIQNAIDEAIVKNSKIINQLHARCPLYTKKLKATSEKRQEAIMFRLQYKIRNEMFNALEKIQMLYEAKKLEELVTTAEHELGVRYRIHSKALVPRKNEFIVDICNYIALAHIDDIIKSKSISHQSINDEYGLLKKILRVNWKTKKTAVPYIFGDQSSYRDPAEPDTSFMEFRKNVVRLEDRLSQKPMLKIERCHLLYEMGKANLKQQRTSEAREFGLQIIKEAEGVSYLWIFLGKITVIRADVLNKQFQNAIKSIEETLDMIDILKSEDLKLILEHVFEIVKRLS